MKVSLLSVTPDALTLLLRTKGTRLGHAEDPATWPEEKRAEHLDYMRDTIKSSWEFVDYVFQIEDVTRAFTHQLVRTRTGAYAQESQRTVDVSNHGWANPFEGENSMRENEFDNGAFHALRLYGTLLELQARPGDARGILPTNVLTSIIAKFNLRTLHEMAKVRLCTRTQGEYQNVFREMKRLVEEVHPWVAEHNFIEVQCASTGTCAFPRYGKKECPVWFQGLDTSIAADVAKERWAKVRHEASPVAKDGKAS